MFSKQLSRISYSGVATFRDIEGAIERIEAGIRPSLEEAMTLLQVTDYQQYYRIMDVASRITEENHSNKIGLIAPLYFSNVCRSECSCCDMSRTNRHLERITLEYLPFQEELNILKDIGYKTIELVGGGFPLQSGLGQKFLQFMEYGKQQVPNWAFFMDTFEEQDYHQFADPNITMIHWQESYDNESYHRMVKAGPKFDFEKRLNAQDFWIKAGGRKLGLSILAGLSPDFLKDVFLILAHGKYLEGTYGISPSCFGTVRMQQIRSGNIEQFAKISDEHMYLVTALYRTMFPKSNIITTSREPQKVIAKQLSAGATFTNTTCTTIPGGYVSLDAENDNGQFCHENPSIETVKATVESVGKTIDWEKEL